MVLILRRAPGPRRVSVPIGAALLLVVAVAACGGGDGDTGDARADGLLAFWTREESAQHLYVAEADTGAVRRISTGKGSSYTPSWSPDGRRLVFGRSVGDTEQIVVVDLDSGREQVVVAAYGRSPSWSPRGDRIAFMDTSGEEIATIAADGSAKRLVTSAGVLSSYPAWSPDGRRLVLHHDDAVLVVDLDGSSPVRIDTAGIAPTFSPDGTRIAFAVIDPATADLTLAVASADGKTVRDVAEDAGASEGFAWSPDGRLLVYQNDEGGLSVVSSDGTQRRVLTEGGSDTAPAWAPDGQAVAFLRPSPSGWTIQLVPAAGGGERLLAGPVAGHVADDLVWQPQAAAAGS